MRVGVITLIIILNIIVETTLMPFLKINGITPDIMTTFIVSFGLLGGNPIAPIVGLFAGLLYDMTMGSIIGIYALQYMLIGFVIGSLNDKFYVGSFIIPMAFAAVSIILKEIIMFLYMFFIGLDVSVVSVFLNKTIPQAILTSIITPIIFYMMRKLYRYKFMTKKWYFKDS